MSIFKKGVISRVIDAIAASLLGAVASVEYGKKAAAEQRRQNELRSKS